MFRLLSEPESTGTLVLSGTARRSITPDSAFSFKTNVLLSLNFSLDKYLMHITSDGQKTWFTNYKICFCKQIHNLKL